MTMKGPVSEKVNIATLKAQLARFLRMVRAGTEIVVTDHRESVARIVPYEDVASLQTIKPKASFSELAKKKVPKRPQEEVDSLSYLLEERGKR